MFWAARVRLELQGFGELADVTSISRLVANIPALDAATSEDLLFKQYRPGQPAIEDFRFQIQRYRGEASPDVALLESWWKTVQSGNLQRRTIGVEVLSNAGVAGFRAELRDSIPISYDPLSQTMTVRVGSMSLLRLRRANSTEIFGTPSVPPSTFNYRFEIDRVRVPSLGDVSGGNTVIDVNYGTGTDPFAHATVGQQRVAPLNVLVAPNTDPVIEAWIQSVLNGGPDWERDIVVTHLLDNGIVGQQLLHLTGAFPTRLVFLDASFVDPSVNGMALAVAITAQANGSQQ
jgi:hypothetical protein